MSSDAARIWLTDDPALARLSERLNASPPSAVAASSFFYRATRVAADITVVESSLLTLTIADATLPVLPGITKIEALAVAALSAVALAAASIDIVVQLGELKISMGILSGASEEDLKAVNDRLETLTDPIGGIIDEALDYLGKLGFDDADLAALTKEATEFIEAREAARKATTPQDKLKRGLAAIQAANKFFSKLGPTLQEKLRKERDRAERERNYKELREAKPQYPDGVDYPNQPGSGSPDPDGGSEYA